MFEFEKVDLEEKGGMILVSLDGELKFRYSQKEWDIMMDVFKYLHREEMAEIAETIKERQKDPIYDKLDQLIKQVTGINKSLSNGN